MSNNSWLSVGDSPSPQWIICLHPHISLIDFLLHDIHIFFSLFLLFITSILSVFLNLLSAPPLLLPLLHLILCTFPPAAPFLFQSTPCFWPCCSSTSSLEPIISIFSLLYHISQRFPLTHPFSSVPLCRHPVPSLLSVNPGLDRNLIYMLGHRFYDRHPPCCGLVLMPTGKHKTNIWILLALCCLHQLRKKLSGSS